MPLMIAVCVGDRQLICLKVDILFFIRARRLMSSCAFYIFSLLRKNTQKNKRTNESEKKEKKEKQLKNYFNRGKGP